MSILRHPSQESEDPETLIPCPRCHGNGQMVFDDDGKTYRTKICRWCDGSGGVNHAMIAGWNRLQRWIVWYTLHRIPFAL